MPIQRTIPDDTCVRTGYYYGNSVYTDDDGTGTFLTRFEELDSCNRGCTKIEIVDVKLGPHRWELTVRYPNADTTWLLHAHIVRAGKWRKRPGGIGFIDA